MKRFYGGCVKYCFDYFSLADERKKGGGEIWRD